MPCSVQGGRVLLFLSYINKSKPNKLFFFELCLLVCILSLACLCGDDFDGEKSPEGKVLCIAFYYRFTLKFEI